MKSKLARQIVEEMGSPVPIVSFPFLGEMHLEGMHEAENAFFGELLRENDLEGEELEMLAPSCAYWLDMKGTDDLN